MVTRLALALLGLVSLVSHSALKDDVELDVGGFIKVDLIWSQYSDQLRAGNIGDDLVVPSTIAVGDGSNSDQAVFDGHAKFSRIWFKPTLHTPVGEMFAYIETDFNSAADERIANQAAQGLRHAFFNWKIDERNSILAGQTWTTFLNPKLFPSTNDFLGSTSGAIFARQAQLRWTHAFSGSRKLHLAVENPSSTLINGDRSDDDNQVPDLVARYENQYKSLSYSFSAIVREIAFTDDEDEIESEFGFGWSVAGLWKTQGKSNLKFTVSGGHLGRYIALGSFRDGVILDDGDIDTTTVLGGFAAYEHYWTPKWASTFLVGLSEADNPDAAGEEITKKVSNYSANLLYYPVPALSLGVEFIHAERELENGVDGDLDRLQFTGKFRF